MNGSWIKTTKRSGALPRAETAANVYLTQPPPGRFSPSPLPPQPCEPVFSPHLRQKSNEKPELAGISSWLVRETSSVGKLANFPAMYASYGLHIPAAIAESGWPETWAELRAPSRRMLVR